MIIDYGIQKTWDIVPVRIPTANPWKVFAWFQFGGRNYCPHNEEMLWIVKYRYEKEWRKICFLIRRKSPKTRAV